MNQLGDLRQRWQHDQLRSKLRMQEVPAFRPSQDGGRPNSTIGLDILIRVVRHLLSQLKAEHFDPTAGEPENPLLQLVWADLEQVSPRRFDEARLHVLQALTASHVPLARQDLSFARLVEAPLMLETLWSRTPMIIFRDDVLTLPKGDDASTWKRVKHADNSILAGRSMVAWKQSQVLSNLIEHVFVTEDTPTATIMWECSHPGIIRVRMEGTGEDYFKFRRLSFNMTHLAEVGEEGDLVYKRVSMPVDYELIACVKLAKNRDDPEFLRLWEKNGSPIAISDAFGGVDDSAPLGVDGESYMLYYAQALPQGFNVEPRAAPIKRVVSVEEHVSLFDRIIRHR